jgi:predicted RNase H-like nuclease (RuvC/YqgF family)|tara:strand:- start:237 stop:623 length:387 start_codon:yes stop_codon:yes gene_type:complete
MTINRYLCTVLAEFRTAIERISLYNIKGSKRHLAALVEEVQTLANRMEAGLRDKKAEKKLRKKVKVYERRVLRLRKQVKHLEIRVAQENSILERLERNKKRADCEHCDHTGCDECDKGGLEGLGSLFG